MFKEIGLGEIILLAVILLVLFGGRKLPELGKGLGESIKEIKKTFKEKPKGD